MRASSKLGFKGVRKTKSGKFHAFYSRWGVPTGLGNFPTIEDAARAVDLETIRRRGIVNAIELGLNVAPSAEQLAAYDTEIARREALARFKVENDEREKRAIEIPSAMNPELLRRFQAGEAPAVIAHSLGYHKQAVIERLRTLVTANYEALGLTLTGVHGTSGNGFGA